MATMPASIRWIQHHGRRCLSASTSTLPIRPRTMYPSQISSHTLIRNRFSSSTLVSTKYATVDHSLAYENALTGPHGSQLDLARLEGKGKDDPPFDPFKGEDESNFEEDDDDDSDEYSGSSDIEDNEDDNDESLYRNDGFLRRPKSTLATLRAGFPSGGFFAIIELGGTQHKVTVDDLIVSSLLLPVEKFKIGSVHTLSEVMLVGSSHKTLVGLPFVSGAEVDLLVEEITQDAKVIIFKKRRRKHSQRKNGFRRDITLLRVLDVRMPEEHAQHDYVSRSSLEDKLSNSLEEKSLPLNPVSVADLKKVDESTAGREESQEADIEEEELEADDTSRRSQI